MFQRPAEILTQQNHFSQREVGLTHPDNPSFVRLRDNGDIEVFASEGLGFVLHRQSRSISFIADNIKFHTKTDQGLRWNRLAFNSKAMTYSEPAFIEMKDDNMHQLYKGSQDYFPPEKTQ